MATTKNIDHVAQALSKLPIYSRKPNNEAYLTAFINRIQELEDTFWQLYSERNVNTAVGLQLTIIGKIVGQEREGVTDDDIFRRYVRAKISVNSSKGVIEDLYTITDLVVDDITANLRWDNNGAAAGVMHVEDAIVTDSVGAVLWNFLKKAVSAGVRLIVTWEPAVNTHLLRFCHLATLSGAHGASAGALTTNGIPAEIPSSGGTIRIDFGLAEDESVTYTSHDGTTFTLSGTTSFAHPDATGIYYVDPAYTPYETALHDNGSPSDAGYFVNAKG